MAKDLEYTFFHDNTQMANKHMKSGSNILLVRGVQTRTSTRAYFTPTRMARIQKAEVLATMGGSSDPRAQLVGM